MIFLDGPCIGESKEAWEVWLKDLSTMNQRDESVKFAIKLADRILSEMARVEALATKAPA